MNKWETSSDIVLLAKEMCMMMMDMSDFTRYMHIHMHTQQRVEMDSGLSPPYVPGEIYAQKLICL